MVNVAGIAAESSREFSISGTSDRGDLGPDDHPVIDQDHPGRAPQDTVGVRATGDAPRAPRVAGSTSGRRSGRPVLDVEFGVPEPLHDVDLSGRCQRTQQPGERKQRHAADSSQCHVRFALQRWLPEAFLLAPALGKERCVGEQPDSVSFPSAMKI